MTRIFANLTNYFNVFHLWKSHRSVQSVFYFILLVSVVACKPDDCTNPLTIRKATGSSTTFRTDWVIPECQTVILEPGAKILLAEGVNISVLGELKIEGTADNPAYIGPASPGKQWGRILLENPDGDYSFSHAHIEEGGILGEGGSIDMEYVRFTNQSDYWGAVHAEFFGMDVVVSHCSIESNWKSQGIVVHNVPNGTVIVEDSRFTNLIDPVEFIRVDGGVIRRNRFFDMVDDCIDLDGCTNVLIEHNEISNFGNQGIEISNQGFGPSTGIVIRNNILTDCIDGIAVIDGSEARVENNTFFRCEHAVVVEEQAPGTGSGTATIRNCIIARSGAAPVKTDAAATVDLAYTLFDANFLPGTGNLQADPLFFSDKILDFRLRPGSPAIDAGDPASASDSDGSPADLGAFPFHLNDRAGTRLEN